MYILAALTVASVLATGYAQSAPGFTPVTSQHLSVKYGSIDLTSVGITLPGSQTTDAPSLAYNSLDGTYVAIMLDLSIQIPHVSGNTTLLHWMASGLASSPKDGPTLTTAAQNALAPYLGPSPPAGQTHTYTVLLYKQPANFSIPAGYVAFFNNVTASGSNRIGFDVANFTAEAGLGAAVAANWFLEGTPATAASGSVSASASASASTSAKATTSLVSGASFVSRDSVLITVAILGFAFNLV